MRACHRGNQPCFIVIVLKELCLFVAEEASGICRPSRGSKEVHWLNRSSGTFFTPDYPLPYPDYTWCIWIISVPAEKRVQLKFEDFEIERVSQDCALSMREKKYVQILDGQVSASKYLALYCGYHGPLLLMFIPLEGTCGWSFRLQQLAVIQGLRVSKPILKL